uniref:CHAT domain-containing tetratricopeptide repeat protein n=1 Tax=Parerythrobacter lutipelagi TaxID=1964208 RepID=UPI0010F5C690|nr:CHAT domain-containing protein [Parerythrobacter lutipelagi]
MKLAQFAIAACIFALHWPAAAQPYQERQAAALEAFEEAQAADDFTRKTAAYSAYIGALAEQKDEQGLDDPRMLRAIFRLADIYRQAGSRYNSEYLHARLLAAQEIALGRDHPDTQRTLRSMLTQTGWQEVSPEGAFLFAQLAWPDMQKVFWDTTSDQKFVSEIAALFPGPSSNSMQTADALNALAVVLHDAPAIEQAERANRMLLDYFASDGTLPGVAPYEVHYRLGQLYSRVNRFDEAGGYLATARDEMEQALAANAPQVLELDYSEAELLRKRGSLSRAEQRHLKLLKQLEAIVPPTDPRVARTYGGLARTYLAQGRAEEALALFQTVLEMQETVEGKASPDELENILGLAEAHRALGNHKTAAPLFQRAATRLRESLGLQNQQTLQAMVGQADNLRGIGEFDRAEELLDQARSIADEMFLDQFSWPGTDPITAGLANLYYETGRDREAERLFRRLLDTQRSQLGREHPFTIETARKLARIRLRDETTGRDPISPARMTVAALRTRQRSASTLRIAQSQREAEDLSRASQFSMLADAAWKTQSAPRASLYEEVFAALQDSIAGPANRAIAQMAVRRYANEAGSGLPALVQRREDAGLRFDANLEQSNSLIGSTYEEDRRERARLENEREALVAELDRIDAQLRAEFANYFAMIQPEAVPIGAAKQLLKPDQAILLVVPSEFGTHTIAISSTEVAWHRSALSQDDIQVRVNRLRWDLGATVSDPRAFDWAKDLKPGEGVPYSRSIAFELFSELVAPVDTLIADKAEIYVAAGGALAGLPFSVLITEAPAGTDADPAALRNSAWLADRQALVNIPSIQSLQLLKSDDRTVPADESGNGFGADSFIGFGDPVLAGAAKTRGARQIELPPTSRLFDQTDTRSGTQLANVDALRSLASLPGTRVELENMRALMGVREDRIFLGERATESAVRNEDLSSARILAFATHGITGFELADLAEPGLVLTPPASASEADDGYLSASEVATLRISAEWVILSACNTATGETHGLSGLSRAFFYAGAQNLLASHWPVDDTVASRITVRTLELQRDNPDLRRAQAFHQAMREIRMDAAQDTIGASWAHPQFWAPFVLIGGANER